MNFRKYLSAAALLIAVLALSGTALASDAQHVLVLDQSGSMEPFWNHPQDKLRTLLKTITGLDGIFTKQEHVSVLLFSEAGAKTPSPQALFRGSVADLRAKWPDVADGLKAIPQWTDLVHGLKAGVKEAEDAKGDGPRILWFLTDNVGEQAQGRERQDTVSFYQALKTAPEFQGFTDIQVFPLDLQHPTEQQGLMLYAMLWVPPGTPAADQDRMVKQYRAITAKLADSKQPEFMGQLPLLVKPLDQQPFRLEVTEFAKEGGKPVPIKMSGGKVMLPADLFKEGEPIKGTLSGRLVSNYETFKIPQAKLGAALSDPRTIDFNPVTPGLQKVEGENLGEIGARGTSQPFSVRLELPPLAASWNMQSLLGTTGQVETDLELTVSTSGGLEIDTSRISHLTFHGMTELPKLFAKDVKVLPVAATLQIPVKYSGARFAVAVAALVALLALALGLVLAIVRFINTRSEWILTNPDGTESFLIFRRWHRKEFVVWEGTVVGTLVFQRKHGLTFQPDSGEEPQTLEDGGVFTALVDEQLLTFRTEPRHPSDTGGEDDVA
jgi:hypothetical protein